MTKEIRFESEFILHRRTQEHLDELFGLKLVASEKQRKGLRPDNIAFDEESKTLVIIEYKNRPDENVLNQVQDYYDLAKEDKNFFTDLLENEFKNIRVMIIGPKFSDEQIKEAKNKFELWEVTLFDDGEVNYENLETHEIKKMHLEPEELKLTEELLLEDKTPEMKKLYFMLKNGILNEFDDVEIRYLVGQISFRVNDHIICIAEFLKSSFNIYIYAESLSNAENTEDISKNGTGGKANYKLKYESDDDFDYFMDLFKQAYNQKKVLK